MVKTNNRGGFIPSNYINANSVTRPIHFCKRIAGSEECFPKCVSIKGRTGNPTPLVHKDMTKIMVIVYCTSSH